MKSPRPADQRKQDLLGRRKVSSARVSVRPAGIDELPAVAFSVGAEGEELESVTARLKGPRAAGGHAQGRPRTKLDELTFHDRPAAACDDDVDLLVDGVTVADGCAYAGLDALQAETDALAAERLRANRASRLSLKPPATALSSSSRSSTRPYVGVLYLLISP